MENSRVEAYFREASKNLEESRAEIKETLEQKKESLEERDSVRLTRILQLLDKYTPDRELPELTKWRRMLQSWHRFLPLLNNKKKSLPNLDRQPLASESYLLAEQALRTLRDLRRLDKVLDQDRIPESNFINQERPETIISSEILDTSLTLDYEKKHWGVERVCLDGIQNHLPADSKGERVWVMCLVDGTWQPLAAAKLHPDKIKKVCFIDDGAGFDVKHLSLLYSTKSKEVESAGQFGEGMKMIAAASLREGIELEYESQNWRAWPVAKNVEIKNTRGKTNEKVEQLSFKVDHLTGVPMVGSRTTIHKPSEGFIRELVKLEDKVLALRGNYHPAFIGQSGEIVGRKPGMLFVKGIFVRQVATIFSYNFNDVETNRDRNTVTSVNIEDRVKKLIYELSNKGLIKTLLHRSILNPDALESRLYGYYSSPPEHPTIWRDSFYEAFGKDAVLDTKYEIPEAFSGMKVKKIRLPDFFMQILIASKVKLDKEAVPDTYQETLPTSLTLDYGKEVWDRERMMLDFAQNHLPRDTDGSMIGMRFKTKDGIWHDFKELIDTKDEDVERIKIFDDGRGYDYRLLSVLYSTKGGSSAGKFGEGLKMSCAAALRDNERVELRSQNWVAIPKVKTQDIGGKNVHQIEFQITHGVKKRPEDDDVEFSRKTSSSTSFINPSTSLIREFREINGKILDANRVVPEESTSEADILYLSGGALYVKQILIPGNHQLLFGYHLRNFDMRNRDRNTVTVEELSDSIGSVLREVKSSNVIRQFLFKAKECTEQGKLSSMVEFNTYFNTRNPEVWKQVFQEMFGENTAIRNVSSQDFNAIHQNLHVGLNVVTLPDSVYNSMRNIGLPSYEDRISEMTDVDHIPDEELTDVERATLQTLTAINGFLPRDRQDAGIKVYNKKRDNQHVALGYSDGIFIHLYRPILKSLEGAADVYIHEKVHHNTGGAEDADSRFRDYLSFTAAKLALAELRKSQPELFKDQQ